jgi:hypothetical protein
VLTILALCERLNASPSEIRDMDPQFVLDVLTVMGQEAELRKEKEARG